MRECRKKETEDNPFLPVIFSTKDNCMFYKQCQRDLLVYEKTKQKYRLSMLRLRVSWRVHTVVVVAQGPGLRHLVDGEQPAEGMANATGWTDASALHVGSGGPRLLFMLLAGLRGILQRRPSPL